MEHEKRCLACGAILDEDEENCPYCGLEGQNRLFFSLEECDAWLAEQVTLRRRTNKPYRLFAGDRYALILHGSGRLYAIGSNRFGACGTDVPEEMTSPVLLAEHVRHAAAGFDNVAYVTEERGVRIIGEGRLAGFRWNCRADEVYGSSDGFFIRDEKDRWFFYGDRTALGEGDFLESVVMTLQRTEGIGKQSVWTMYAMYGGDYSEKEYPTEIPENAEAIAEIKRSAPYRKIAEEYGEANVSVRADDILTGQRIGCIYETESAYEDFCTYTVKCSFVPSIVVTNRYTRRPTPCEKPLDDLRSFDECGLTGSFLGDDRKPDVKLSKKVGGFFCWLDWENTLHVEYRDGKTSKCWPEIKNILDFAFFGSSFLLVGEHNELLTGKLKSYGNPEWPDMTRIDL